jgi:formylglycine-generating enzyme required for sulfatase activity
VGLPEICGPKQNENCCTSLLVTGGTFFRDYDGVSDGYTSKNQTATVSDFRLDRFEITIGRFRKFIEAWDGGYRPAPGAGKHAYLNGGNGLAVVTDGGYESGWDPAWNVYLGDLADAAPCGGCAWTSPPPPGHDNLPMYGLDWYDAYAFCIWDGGFLPTDSEWNYAAAGGAEQRVYPWSSPPTSTTIDCSYAYYVGSSTGYCPGTSFWVGAYSPKSDGKYGQADLAASVWEWDLDWVNPNVTNCVDCVSSQVPRVGWGLEKELRGGAGDSDARILLVSLSEADLPDDRIGSRGARCARPPTP